MYMTLTESDNEPEKLEAWRVWSIHSLSIHVLTLTRTVVPVGALYMSHGNVIP